MSSIQLIGRNEIGHTYNQFTYQLCPMKVFVQSANNVVYDIRYVCVTKTSVGGYDRLRLAISPLKKTKPSAFTRCTVIGNARTIPSKVIVQTIIFEAFFVGKNLLNLNFLSK